MTAMQLYMDEIIRNRIDPGKQQQTSNKEWLQRGLSLDIMCKISQLVTLTTRNGVSLEDLYFVSGRTLTIWESDAKYSLEDAWITKIILKLKNEFEV